MQRSRANTELMVLVTPELAAPLPAGQPTPNLNFSQEFMPSNSNIPMANPTVPVSAAAAPPAAIPIEQLLDSLKPEPPLNSDMAPGGGGYGASGGTGMTQPMTH
jgi:Flp pilus assembly secretin CpaC